MLKIILIIVAAIIVIIFVAAAFMKKEYSISSIVVINRPQDTVFNYIKLLRNQEHYSKWVMADPKVKLEYKGTDGHPGFIASWKSDMKNVGMGEQEIIAIRGNEGYDAEIRFEKPFKGISYVHTKAEYLAPNQTRFTTTFDTKTPFPMNLMIPMITKMLQKDMDENSATLKKVLERQ